MRRKLGDIAIQFARMLGFFKWQTDSFKVLIYEPDFERRLSFTNKVANGRGNNLSPFDFKIVKSRIFLKGYLPQADVAYCYGISEKFSIEHLRLLYIGVVGYNVSRRIPAKLVVKTPCNYAAQYIADYLLAVIAAYERNLFYAEQLKQKRKWEQKEFFCNAPKEMRELKIGIIGLGSIGQKAAHHFLNLECKVYGFDLIADLEVSLTRYYSNEDWKEMLEFVDYLIIAIPYTKDNHHLINESLLLSMHKNICIVNVSRGNIIDESALVKALENNLIRGAILDVFEVEPLPEKSKLWRLQNALLTPHISGNIKLVYNLIQDDFLKILKEMKFD